MQPKNQIIQQTQQPQQPQQNVDLLAGNFFNSRASFVFAMEMAHQFANSTLVPNDYRNNPANCLIALEIALRIGSAPMMVMQNLYVVNGRPAWSAQFIVAMINTSGKYKTEIQYEFSGEGEEFGCFAYAIDRKDRKVVGPTITMKMARKEGWLDKNGSKWKTMPEVMMRYTIGSYFFLQTKHKCFVCKCLPPPKNSFTKWPVP